MARAAKPLRQNASNDALVANNTPNRAEPAGTGNDAASSGEPVSLGVEATQAMLNVSLNASLGLLQFIGQLHEIQKQTLQNVDVAFSGSASDGGSGSSLQDLLQSQMTMAAEHFAKNAKMSTELFINLMDAEAQWVEQAQQNVSTLTQSLLPGGANGSTAAVNGKPQPAAASESEASPLTLFGTAQTAIAQMTKLWVDAVSQGTGQHH